MNLSWCRSQEEELHYLKMILDQSPALISIQQMDDLGDPSSNHNLWLNRKSLDFIGFSREEINKMGPGFFLETMHPDDLEMISTALGKMVHDNSVCYGGVYRLKPRNSDYRWVVGAIKVFESRNGIPWRFLNFSLEIDDMKDTQNQIVALTREIRQLKNRIRIDTLSKREKEVIRLITAGNTDREIANLLFISPATAKTHRNKIHRKLGVRNNAQLVQFAIENDLVST